MGDGNGNMRKRERGKRKIDREIQGLKQRDKERERLGKKGVSL